MSKSISYINSLSKDGFSKFMAQSDINEERLIYVYEHIRQFLLNNKEIAKPLFISSLDDNSIEELYNKYFNPNKLSRCHPFAFDTISMMKSILYTDSLENMYLYLSNRIETFREEVIIGFVTGSLSGSFNNEVKDILGKNIGIKNASSN